MKFLVLTIFFSLFSVNVLAHSGGLNDRGCHNDRRIGDYHCHRRTSFNKQEKFIGIPKVVDGDTIKIGRVRIRLHGIDAPESNQMCSSDGKEWRCGWEATNALANIVGKHWVTCIKTDVDRFKRIVAICRVGPINLNAWMVENGWAVAYRRYSLDYIREEEVSRASGRGLWRGEFIMPWDWRRSK